MTLCEQHSGIVSDVTTLKESDKEQWAAINKVRDRPPVWCTVVIALLTAAVAWFARGGG